MFRTHQIITALVAAPLCCALPLASAEADAGTVTFTGTVVNTCILTLSTPGVLAASSDGTTLSSESTGGVAAIMAVVSTGSSPTLSFTAPTLTGPTGWTGTAVSSMKFSSLSGAVQTYTSSAFTAHLGQLLDTLTINGKAVSTSGFASGAYQLASTVTCQQ